MGVCSTPVSQATRGTIVLLLIVVAALLLAPAAFAADPVEPLWTNVWSAKSPGEVTNAQVVRSAKSDIFTACSVFRPSYSTYDVIVAKYRPDGTRKWVRSWSRGTAINEMVEGVATDPNGNLIVVGSYDKGGQDDWFVLKYDRDGYLQWAKTTGGIAGDDDRAVDVVVNKYGRIFVTGFVTQLTGGKNWRTVKYKPNGDSVWARTFKGAAQLDDEPVAMAIDAARNIYVTGFEGTDQKNHLNKDAVTLKYAPDGTAEWVLPFNMQYEETGVDIAVRKTGVVVAVKAVDEDPTFTHGYALTYSRDGESLMAASLDYGSTTNDEYLCAGIDGLGASVFAGFQVHDDDSNALLTQYDADGVSQWGFESTGPGNVLGDQFNEMFVALGGNVWVTGSVAGAAVTWSFDAAGAERWNAVYDVASESDSGQDMHVTSKSAYVVAHSGTSLVLLRYPR
ncbi:MAG: hypothetical protein V2J16_08675 [Thermoleophilia bacterium]|jgi:hypothetical protein|nr:hypothetical protein [Thermoleophilia bacterium]